MNPPPDFEANGNYAVFRPAGEIGLEEAMRQVEAAISAARERGITRLLVVTTAWTGLRQPSTTERYYYVSQWAEKAGGLVRMAVVVSPELIDPERFGVTVARNRGFLGNVFTSEQEAIDWLQTP